MSHPLLISGEVGKKSGFGNHPVTVIPNYEVPLPDGTKLALKIWFPRRSLDNTIFSTATHEVVYHGDDDFDPVKSPVPVILEALPYRKSEWSAMRDHPRHVWFTSHGYTCIRSDYRGTGDSEGLYYGEYLPEEQRDCMDLIDWISKQAWCNGAVGMYGKSWGGFNGLQVAFYQPPALKAVISLYSTDDRYLTDMHYDGGCVIGNGLSTWAANMFIFNAKPPNPNNVPDWKERWLNRLEKAGENWVKEWLSHQCWDSFWKHGSICEDFSKVTCPVLAIGGWADGYTDAVFRMVKNLPCVKGLVGPWPHNWPDTCTPGPNIAYLDECLKWYDYHLKGVQNGVMDVPNFRMYLQDSIPPAPTVNSWPGKWVVYEESKVMQMSLVLDNANQAMVKKDLFSPDSASTPTRRIESHIAAGLWNGEWLSCGEPGSFPLDQAFGNSLSLCWDTHPLEDKISIAGFPVLDCVVSIEGGTCGQLAATLCDVFPDGKSQRISYGVLNLTHRNGHSPEDLSEMVPGKEYKIQLKLHAAGYVVPEGHKIRLAVAPCFWPSAWPSKDNCTLSFHSSPEAQLSLLHLPIFTGPIVDQFEQIGYDTLLAPARLGPDLPVTEHRATQFKKTLKYDVTSRTYTIQCISDEGRYYLSDSGTITDGVFKDKYIIQDNDPQSAKAISQHAVNYQWPGIDTRMITNSEMWSDKDNFYLRNKLTAHLNGEVFFEKLWEDKVERYMV